jgi:carboxyl-terminal processing protease
MSPVVRTSLIFAAGLLVGSSVLLGRQFLAIDAAATTTATPASPDAAVEPPTLIDEVAGLIHNEYVAAVPAGQLERRAVEGLLEGLDPHSALLDANQLDEIRLSTRGSYTGVGIEVSVADDEVTVVAPIEGSPAALAGVRSGDVILSVNGEVIDSTSLDAVVGRMRGEPGTLVQLAVRREEVDSPLLFELERSEIHLRTVRSTMLEGGIGYLRIAQFTDETPANVDAAVLALRAERPDGGLQGLVMDLRGNPGGVLESGVQVADSFLEAGLIVRADGRTATARFSMDATPGDVSGGVPMAILLDEGTASAAEIVAAALRDHQRAALIGRRSFGKGSVQTVMPLRDGQALKLTTSLYYTPSGRSIHEKGLLPDVVLPEHSSTHGATGERASAVASDPEVRAAAAYLRDRRLRPQLASSRL